MGNNGVLDVGGKFIITYDEEKKVVVISTPGNNLIEINDDYKQIRLVDQHKNEIKMDSGGITLTSSKDIILKAKGNITMDATMKLSGTAKQDISLEGMNVKVHS